MIQNFSWNKVVIFLIIGVLDGGCASSSLHIKEDRFLSVLNSQPELVWSPQVGERVRKAIADFKAHKVVKDRMEYGASVRTFSLEKKSASEIDHHFKSIQCFKKKDVLKNPKTQDPLIDKKGEKIPMIIYLCPDGGVVRIKPQGDSTSRFRPQPHGSKSLRFPYNGKFESFDDEVVKVDNAGNPIPKWTRDLNPLYGDSETQREFVEGWAQDAHTDLNER